MGGSILFAAFALIVQLVPVAWLVRELVRAVTAPRRAPREPACEKCRYTVTGLKSFICPECGSDLRTTGIITRSMEMRRRSSTGVAVAAWWLLWFWVSTYGVFVVGSARSGLEDLSGFWFSVLAAWLVAGTLVTWLVVRRRHRLLREFDTHLVDPSPPDPTNNAGP